MRGLSGLLIGRGDKGEGFLDFDYFFLGIFFGFRLRIGLE